MTSSAPPPPQSLEKSQVVVQKQIRVLSPVPVLVVLVASEQRNLVVPHQAVSFQKTHQARALGLNRGFLGVQLRGFRTTQNSPGSPEH